MLREPGVLPRVSFSKRHIWRTVVYCSGCSCAHVRKMEIFDTTSLLIKPNICDEARG